MQLKSIAIVIPIYNEEENIPILYKKLNFLAQKKSYLDFTYIFINDGSYDNSLRVIRNFANKDKRVKIIDFSRNFGHQIAVTAGLDYSDSDAVVIIDADLQDPPELIDNMIDMINQGGYDIVYAKRNKRLGESWHKKLTAKIYYLLLNKISNTQIPTDTGDFRIITRRVVNELVKMRETHRFIRGMVPWCGFKSQYIYFDRNKRHAGGSNYPYNKMIAFALNGIFSFSSAPIKILTYFGLGITLLSFLGAFIMFNLWLFSETFYSGTSLIFMAVLFFSGINLLGLGIIGLYIGKIFEQQKQRPLYIISEKVNLD